MDYFLHLEKNREEMNSFLEFDLTIKDLEVVEAIIRPFKFGSAIETQDLIQDLIIKLATSYDPWDEYELNSFNVRRFVIQQTYRLCIDKWRYEKRRATENVELPEFFQSAFIDYQDLQDSLLDLNIITERLPKKYKEVIKLRFLGYSHKAIANRLKISVSASRKRIQRARKLLKQTYKEELVQLVNAA